MANPADARHAIPVIVAGLLAHCRASLLNYHHCVYEKCIANGGFANRRICQSGSCATEAGCLGGRSIRLASNGNPRRAGEIGQLGRRQSLPAHERRKDGGARRIPDERRDLT